MALTLKTFEVSAPKPEEQHFKNPKWNERGELIVTGDGLPELGGEPVWGLGCPGGCGRFWEFTAEAVDLVETLDADGVRRMRPRGRVGSHFKPVDQAAYTTSERYPNGYLNFRPDPSTPSTVKVFECDRCGVTVKLVERR